YLHSAPTASIEMSHNTLNSWTSEAMPTSLGVSVRRTYGFKWQNIWQNEHLPSDFALKDRHCQPIWTVLWLSWTPPYKVQPNVHSSHFLTSPLSCSAPRTSSPSLTSKHLTLRLCSVSS